MRNKWVISVLLTPHVWLALAALSVAGSFAIDYVEAQKVADRALALRQGPPPAVAIGNFDPGRNVGPAREVRVWAEANLADPVVVTLGEPGRSERALIVPLFPLSEAGKARVKSVVVDGGETGMRRPMPRPEIPNAMPTPDALGVLVHRMPDAALPIPDIDALVSRRFGSGSYGSIVEINGERIDPGEILLVVKGVMAASDRDVAPKYLAVAPYEDGRLVALAPPPSTGLQRALFWGGVTLALGAIVLSFRTVEVLVEEGRKRRRTQERRMSPGMSEKARTRFQALPSQDEVYASERALEGEAQPAKKLIGTTVGKLKPRR